MSEGSKTADKVLDMLNQLADGKFVTPQQLARRMGINRTVAQRLLTTLLNDDFVVRRAGEYALSPFVRELGQAVQRPLRQAVRPRLVDLCDQVRETVVFGILDGYDVVTLDTQQWPRATSVQVYAEIGVRSPLLDDIGGLAMLAEMPEAWVRKATEATQGSAAGHRPQTALADRLAEIRRVGLASSTPEGDLGRTDPTFRADDAPDRSGPHDPGSSRRGYPGSVDTWEVDNGVSALAAAVRGDGAPIGAVAVLVPSVRADDLRSTRGPLHRAARSIEAELTRAAG